MQSPERGKEPQHNFQLNQWAVCIMHGREGSSSQREAPIVAAFCSHTSVLVLKEPQRSLCQIKKDTTRWRMLQILHLCIYSMPPLLTHYDQAMVKIAHFPASPCDLSLGYSGPGSNVTVKIITEEKKFHGNTIW